MAANYISGFLLLSDESIRVGDMIDISGHITYDILLAPLIEAD